MQAHLPLIYLVRHGETPWTLSRQHTGLADIPLTAKGEQDAVRLGQHLPPLPDAKVLVSPLQRARRTCDLAGFGNRAEVDPDLVEWDYGDYEGLTRDQIKEKNPDWKLFRDGCPGGESLAAVGARADRVVTKLRTLNGDAILFSSGHFMRVLAARWLNLDVGYGRLWTLDTTSLSILGYEHAMDEPIIRLWNDRRPGGTD
ncbi:MAG TPA: histidine phosphatase family protein [Caulifigura sp.]|jgi:probable phosphoglycerate mutase|nr:histidine phosphatase family protein [Caulifigura sp.]